MRLHVGNVPNITGFAVCNVPKNHYFWALVSRSLTSDSPDFYRYVDEISKIFFNSPDYRINVNPVHNFLILVHSDSSADIYINNFPIEVKCRAKRSLKEGQLITSRDIADMRELRFPGIDIQESDKVICCIKVGWKFGLYFHLVGEDSGLDIASMQTNLGRLYRELTFQYVYQSLQSGSHFEEMIKDGWFPFIEILGSEYENLAAVYGNEKFAYDGSVRRILNSFNESRVAEITEKWWQNLIFQEKQSILQAGIAAFLQGNEGGYINCSKTLYTEIEGILRVLYFRDTGKGKRIKLRELLRHLTDVGKQSVGEDSLLLPQHFLDYLTGCTFKHFDLETGTVDLSRNSVAHGAAKGEAYTQERALQALLTLDQIYFFLPAPPDETDLPEAKS